MNWSELNFITGILYTALIGAFWWGVIEVIRKITNDNDTWGTIIFWGVPITAFVLYIILK